jgi:integrase/recombinase XerD
VECRNWVCACFLCNTGYRRSALVNIQISDLDLDNGYCRYRYTKNGKARQYQCRQVCVEYLECLPKDCVYLFPTVLGVVLPTVK